MGPNKLETVKALVNAGARIDYLTFSGGTALTNMMENEDSDPNVLQFLSKRLSMFCIENGRGMTYFRSFLNHRKQSQTMKWRMMRFCAKLAYRTGISRSGIVYSLSLYSGSTPLNGAVIRGDVEQVELLLKLGANPYVENDLGMNAFDVCEKCGPFSMVRKVLETFNK